MRSALLHHSCRKNEYGAPGHGARGAALVFDLHQREFPELETAALEQLITARCWRTHRTHSDILTIGTCFDADRLNLGRVEIPRMPAFSTPLPPWR